LVDLKVGKVSMHGSILWEGKFTVDELPTDVMPTEEAMRLHWNLVSSLSAAKLVVIIASARPDFNL
jgi:hypothetical protein